MKVRRWPLIASLLGLAVGVLITAVLPNEIQGENELARLGLNDLSKTEVLRIDLRVTRPAKKCVVFAGQVLATELEIAELRGAFASRADGLVWAAPGRFPAATPEGIEREAPAAAVALLRQWAIVPEGVRRVVVFREVPVRSQWDPRCWHL